MNDLKESIRLLVFDARDRMKSAQSIDEAIRKWPETHRSLVMRAMEATVQGLREEKFIASVRSSDGKDVQLTFALGWPYGQASETKEHWLKFLPLVKESKIVSVASDEVVERQAFDLGELDEKAIGRRIEKFIEAVFERWVAERNR